MGKHSAPPQHSRVATGLALSASLTLMASPAFAQTTTPSDTPTTSHDASGTATPSAAPSSTAATTIPTSPVPSVPAASASSAANPSASSAPAPSQEATQAPAKAQTHDALTRPEARVLKQGDKGADVMNLQRDLATQGYWCGDADGDFGLATAQAVMALQKVAGLERDSEFGPASAKALASKTRPSAKSSKGLVIEVNKDQQVILYVKDGKVQMILNTSTGNGKPYDENGSKGVANTPNGSFTVFRQEEGWHKAPLGELYFPKYFTGGYAIHGANSIPAFPASHGCARVSVPAMDMLWKNNILPMGRTVLVYGK